jgi:hypothetical protein
LKAVARANMWMKRRQSGMELPSLYRTGDGYKRIRREKGGAVSGNSRRKAGGNHRVTGNQSREGLGCSQDSP